MTGIRVAQSHAADRLEGDVSIFPMPATGVHCPPGGGMAITPDGVVVEDATGNPTAFVTSSGNVIVPTRRTACTGCRTPLDRSDKFCRNCGTSTAPPAPTPPAS